MKKDDRIKELRIELDRRAERERMFVKEIIRLNKIIEGLRK